MADEIIKAGTAIIFDHGEYSDSSYTGPFRVERDIDKYPLAEAYREQWKPSEDGWQEEPDYDGFIIWLHKEGYISDLQATSWHIGSYGRFEP
ncbi:hypothetical protein CIW48_26885 [Methylobacterium sp. P1-11]|uniref:hypothetical protein n=1 Tax=Methylobacterium sp. P1-11 TaxID=2024616 RepID=UPI0011EDAC9D|nr:hypothetical protein [Methylobacterium sp. P1-11]KAA0117834.1 hypothetical protein CIW48_26885 [Methylobacterium sp. P1-11]